MYKIIDISTSKLKNTVHPKNAEKVNISSHPHSLIFSFRTAALFAVMVWDFCLLCSRSFSLSLTAASSTCSLCWLVLASVRETWCFAVSDSTLSVASLCKIRLVYNIMMYYYFKSYFFSVRSLMIKFTCKYTITCKYVHF